MAIILDSREISDADLLRFQERTGGQFESVPLSAALHDHHESYPVEDHNAEATAGFIRELELDLLINAGTPRILKASILNAPTIGVLNCHPGILPKYRGCTCVEWAVYLGEAVGNTVHFVDEKIDHGPIVMQKITHASESDEYEHLRARVFRDGVDLMADAVKQIALGDIEPHTLPPQCGGDYFSPISDESLEVVKQRLRDGSYARQQAAAEPAQIGAPLR